MNIKYVAVYLIFSLVSTIVFTQEIKEELRIKIVHENVYVEKGEFVQYLNFDFLIENLSEEKLKLIEILIHAYDNEDKLICRKMNKSNLTWQFFQ